MPAPTKTPKGSADYIFQRVAAGRPPNMSLVGKKRQDARLWFRQQALKVTSVDTAKFISKASDDRKIPVLTRTEVGQMFTFSYDAKLKKRLPYWDRFPLIFMIESYSDGFLGINLHYLPPALRSKLMDALYRNLNNKLNDDTSKLLISYQILKSATKYKYFKPCVKKYLFGHVGSRFMRILPDEWDMALMLPTEQFEKKRKEVVWHESVESVGDE